MSKRITVALIPVLVLIVGIFVLIMFDLVDWSRKIDLGQILEIFTMLVLVIITALYAYSASQQAEASVKMAEEMREQRVMASRPVIILKSVHKKEIWTGNTKDYFSHFEISNVGNSPAIEVESSLTVDKRDYSQSIRQTYLKKDDPPIRFRPDSIANLEENRTYYLVCEYQNIFSSGVQKPLYQTCLPFRISKSSEKGEIHMIAGELESKVITEKERIDAFSSGSKPK